MSADKTDPIAEVPGDTRGAETGGGHRAAAGPQGPETAVPVPQAKVRWFHVAASWVSAVATAGLLAVAIFQVGPAIRHLELQAKNEELLLENSGLEKLNKQQTDTLAVQKREIDRRSRETKELEERHRKMSDSLVKVNDVFADLLKREKERTAFNEQLHQTGERLRRQNAGLQSNNTHLRAERDRLQAALGDLRAELDRKNTEVEKLGAVNRRFVMTDIVGRIRTVIPKQSSTDTMLKYMDAIPDLASGVAPFNSGSWEFMNLKVQPIWPAEPHQKGKVLFQPQAHRSKDDLSRPAYRADLAKAVSGRDVVEAELDGQSLQLLAEQSRLKFQDSVRAYMERRGDVFNLPVFVVRSQLDNFLTLWSQAMRVPGSKYYSESRAKNDGEDKTEVPDAKALDEKISEALKEYFKQRRTVQANRAKFNEALDKMVKDLTPIE